MRSNQASHPRSSFVSSTPLDFHLIHSQWETTEAQRVRAERELKATGEKLEETAEQLGCVTEKLEVEAHVAARAAQNAKQATVQGSQLQVCVGGWVWPIVRERQRE